MKKIITICFLAINLFAYAQISKSNIVIYQNGKEFEVKNDTTSINLKNESFSIRFYVEKDKPNGFLAFIADKEGFLHVGNEQDESSHCFSPGTSKATARGEKPRTVFINDASLAFRGNYYLHDYYLSNIPSKNKNLVRKEFVIKNIENIEMKDFFLKNLYLIYYPESEFSAIEKNLMTKISLRFPDYKQQKTYAEDRINLDAINFETFKPEVFYKEAIANERVTKKSITKRGFQYIEHNIKIEGDKEMLYEFAKNKKFGKTVTYNNLSFPSIDVLTTSKGELIAIAATSHSLTMPELYKFHKHLSTTFSPGAKLKYASEWKDGDKIIQLTLKKIEGFEGKKHTTQLTIINSKFLDKVLKLKTLPFGNFQKTPLQLKKKVKVSTQEENKEKAKNLYDQNCAVCHFKDGGGSIGPNLTDNKWIQGGGEENIYNAISNGGRPGKGMIGWKSILSEEEMKLITNYIISIQGTTPKKSKEAEGEFVWPKE